MTYFCTSPLIISVSKIIIKLIKFKEVIERSVQKIDS